jgi:hypothetical protein
MKKIDSNMLINGFQGSFDKIVFKKVRGKLVISRKPEFTRPATEKQLAQREYFTDASDYGKLAEKDPQLRAYYAPVAKKRQITVYAAAMSDFLSKPKIRSLDVSAYKGQVGDTIEIVTADNVGVVAVQVRISDGDKDLETGAAVEGKPRHWTYTAKNRLSLPILDVIVTARDFPGGQAVKQVNIEF